MFSNHNFVRAKLSCDSVHDLVAKWLLDIDHCLEHIYSVYFNLYPLPAGLVDAVRDLRVTNYTENSLKFEWSDPYTLLGVPILGYNVFVQITTLKDQTTTVAHDGIVYNKEMLVKKEAIDGYCAFVNFTIAAINTAGVGNTTAITEYFSEGELPVCVYLHTKINMIIYTNIS